MHPQLGAVEESFDVLPGTLATAAAVVVPGGVVFDGDQAPVTGVQNCVTTTSPSRVSTVRAVLRHAIEYGVFYWAHATLTVGTLHDQRFCSGLTEAQQRQLFDRHVQWYHCTV